MGTPGDWGPRPPTPTPPALPPTSLRARLIQLLPSPGKTTIWGSPGPPASPRPRAPAAPQTPWRVSGKRPGQGSQWSDGWRNRSATLLFPAFPPSERTPGSASQKRAPAPPCFRPEVCAATALGLREVPGWVTVWAAKAQRVRSVELQETVSAKTADNLRNAVGQAWTRGRCTGWRAPGAGQGSVGRLGT